MEKIVTIGAFEAKKHLSRLLQDVKQGKELIITKRGSPIARMVPYREERQRTMEEIVGVTIGDQDIINS